MTRPNWSVPLLALALLAAPRSARADECGNVSSAGACLDTKTLVFCVDGQLETMICPSGEVCVVDDRFGGGSGCIATRYTDCGEITEVGECAGGDRAVVWCDANRVKARTCDNGTACAWVEDEGWYDCVPNRALINTTTEPDPSDTDVIEPPVGTPDDDAVDGEDPSDTVAESDPGPLPSVEKGGATAQPPVAGGGAGCATGGADPSALVLALGALGALLGRRRD